MTISPADSTAQRHQTRRVRHEVKARLLEVVRVQTLAPHLRRITVQGEELRGFTSLGADDHVRVFFPYPGEQRPVMPGDAGERKPVTRDYTPGRFDPAKLELDLDFVIHSEGPASDWARQAAMGQRLGVGGPRGSHVVPTDFDWYLLMGDETAIPAIARRLGELPAGARAIVRVEVADEREALPLASAATVDVEWLGRGGAAAGASPVLEQALERLTLPAGDGYAWIACESHHARALRQVLLARGLNREWIKAAGYWKLGATGVHETHKD
jgi:NADPH-dependent ferric siderophore reductase